MKSVLGKGGSVTVAPRDQASAGGLWPQPGASGLSRGSQALLCGTVTVCKTKGLQSALSDKPCTLGG